MRPGSGLMVAKEEEEEEEEEEEVGGVVDSIDGQGMCCLLISSEIH